METVKETAWALVAIIDRQPEPAIGSQITDLNNALYTLSEGGVVSIGSQHAIFIWKLVNYLIDNRLDDKFKL